MRKTEVEVNPQGWASVPKKPETAEALRQQDDVSAPDDPTATGEAEEYETDIPRE